MHSAEGSQRPGDIVQQAESVANAAQDGANFAEGPFTISVCDIDLPAFIWDGAVYVQMPLTGFLDAFTASLVSSISDLEARISEAGRAALSSDDFRAALPRTRVAESSVVRSGEQQ